MLKSLSSNDRGVVEKVKSDYAVDNKLSNPNDSRVIKDEFGEDFDVNKLGPGVKKEATLKLQFGKMKDTGVQDEPGRLLMEYQQYFEEGKMELFTVQKDKVFGFINADTFKDSFKFYEDWKVRYYGLEEIYLGICNLGNLKNDQLWNLSKFVYVQLNCGIRMEFLAEYRTARHLLLSIKNFKDGFDTVGFSK